MARSRTQTERQLADLLHRARTSLDLSVAFLTRMDGTTHRLEVVDAQGPLALVFREGYTQAQERTFCHAILNGDLPPVIPDIGKNKLARTLPPAKIPRIRSWVSVPVRFSDGSLYGTFCACGLTTDKELGKRDLALMQVLAGAATVILEPDVRERERHETINARTLPILEQGGPTVVLQPIVALPSGSRVGAEALSRFPASWERPPDLCFQDAHAVGLGDQLELAALAGAAAHLDIVDGYVSMNISAATLLTPAFSYLMTRLPLHRVVLELSEHDPVQDYPALAAALAPLRSAGMQLAIDDVGAGYSSLRHILLTTPDMIKLDRAIIAGVATDPVLRTLVGALREFAHGCEASVVAEGVETVDDADALAELGVDFAQGWFFGRPGPAEALGPIAPLLIRQRANSSLAGLPRVD